MSLEHVYCFILPLDGLLWPKVAFVNHCKPLAIVNRSVMCAKPIEKTYNFLAVEDRRLASVTEVNLSK